MFLIDLTEIQTQSTVRLLDKVDKQTHSADNKLKGVRGKRGSTTLHTTGGRSTLAMDNFSTGHEGPLGSDSAANNRGGDRAAGRGDRRSEVNQRFAGSARRVSGLSSRGTGAVGAGSGRGGGHGGHGGHGGGAGGAGGTGSGLGRAIGLSTGIDQTRVVGLAILGDLECVVAALLDVVIGGPSESAIFGLGGDGLHILKIACVSFAKSKSDRLDSRLADFETTC